MALSRKHQPKICSVNVEGLSAVAIVCESVFCGSVGLSMNDDAPVWLGKGECKKGVLILFFLGIFFKSSIPSRHLEGEIISA